MTLNLGFAKIRFEEGDTFSVVKHNADGSDTDITKQAKAAAAVGAVALVGAVLILM